MGKYVSPDIKKGSYYIIKASLNNCREANFIHGFWLHEGKVIKRDIQKAIHYYKEASSFNIQYAKNNLGILYKNGYDDIKGRSGNAIVFFEEAIRQKCDYLSMYNLAHIYIYDETIKQDLEKSIELLIKSSDQFLHSLVLLCLLLVKKFGFNIEIITQEVKKRTNEKSNLSKKIIDMMNTLKLYEKSIFEVKYELYRKKDFLYDAGANPILSSDLQTINNDKNIQKNVNSRDISSLFYEGFGNDIKL